MQSPSAQIAIDELQLLQEACGSVMLSYFVAPNIILTLAGCRPLADQVYYGDALQRAKWNQEISEALAVMQKSIPMWQTVLSDKNPVGDAYISYDLITASGLGWVLSQTALLAERDKKLLLRVPLNSSLPDRVVSFLTKDKRYADFSTTELEYVAAGILLGYPDAAIMSTVGGIDDTHRKQSIAATIHQSDRYSCPQPVYDYSKGLRDDPSIKAHEWFWSSILDEFYSSEFHTTLIKNQYFLQKINELGE